MGAYHGRKLKVAGLLGQQFLEKIQNGGAKIKLSNLENLEQLVESLSHTHRLKC